MTYAFGAITLSKGPVYPLSPDGVQEDNLIESPTDAGYQQVRPKYTRNVRQWGLNFQALTDADVAALRTYETTTLNNRTSSLSWAHPKTGTFTVRIKVPIDYASVRGPDQNDVKILLREV